MGGWGKVSRLSKWVLGKEGEKTFSCKTFSMWFKALTAW